MGALEAGADQAKVVEQVRQGNARDGDAGTAHVGEVRQPHPSGLVVLTEDHRPVRAVGQAPGLNAALGGAAHAGGSARGMAQQLVEERYRADAGSGFEDRHDLVVEDPGERVGSASMR